MAQDFIKDLLIDSMTSFKEKLESQFLKEGMSRDEASQKALNEIEEKDLSDAVLKIIESVSDEAIVHIKDVMNDNLKIEFEKESHFIDHNYQLWGNAFDMSMTLYLVVIEAADDCHKYYTELSDKEKEENQYRYNVLYHIHGRECQQFLEILWLLRGGFADCAFSRCRSLYELSVVAELISENDESVAKAYFEESDEEKSDNLWAKNLPNIKKNEKNYVSFNQLQNLCTIVTREKWKGVYNTTSQIVHASPQATYGRIGAPNQKDILSVGHSDYGLAEPAIDSAMSLMLVTTFVFDIVPSFDSKMYVRVIQKWVDKLQNCYLDIEDKGFNADLPRVY